MCFHSDNYHFFFEPLSLFNCWVLIFFYAWGTMLLYPEARQEANVQNKGLFKDLLLTPALSDLNLAPCWLLMKSERYPWQVACWVRAAAPQGGFQPLRGPGMCSSITAWRGQLVGWREILRACDICHTSLVLPSSTAPTRCTTTEDSSVLTELEHVGSAR